MIKYIEAQHLNLTSELSAFRVPNLLTQEILAPKTLDEYRRHIINHNPKLIHFAGHATHVSIKTNCLS